MKILLVRTSALGDIIHCLPVLQALRRHLPAARIAWVVEKVWAPLLEGHPDLERLIVVRTKAWRRESRFAALTAIRATVSEMRDFAPDIAFDLMGNFKGAMLARFSGAPRVLGPDSRSRREGPSAIFVKERLPVAATHAVDRALALLRGLDLPPEKADFGGSKLLNRAPAAAKAFLEDPNRAGRPLVLITAGAGWANKRWPPRSWAEVAIALAGDGFDVVLPTAPGEEALAEEIAQLSSGAARTVDAKDFNVLAALIRASALFLGGDTGPIHLAHALGTPVLALIGPTDPRRNGPYEDAQAVLFHELACSYCYKRFDEPKACLLALTPTQVLAAARARLSAER
jgi:lipopolysaccharide heptosyltransferase I